MLLADPAAPTIELIDIARIHKGEPVNEELCVQYRPAGGIVRASLLLLSGWHGPTQTYRRADFYHVETLDSPLGRAFRLWRDRRKVERDPDHESSYWVLVNGSGGQCDCKGFLSASRDGRTCKHLAVMARLAEVGAV